MARTTTPPAVREHGAMRHDSVPTGEATGRDGHGTSERSSGGHGGPGDHGGHGDHVAVFRRRFWWSLLLTVPVVASSHMVMDWLGYSLDFPGLGAVGPVLGTVIFAWAGWPFLSGGVSEVRERQPGMMLLITLAIAVAYVASMATSLGWFGLEFWWELALLVTIMLLGHWQEMKALGQARS
ncbi:MAG: heavy metal translocating P-type ATPase, partial [Haloechinothrix sp.]